MDQTGTISGPELREALRASDIQVNNRILNMLMLRYANEKGVMEMEDFLHCCIKLTAMIRELVRIYYVFLFPSFFFRFSQKCTSLRITKGKGQTGLLTLYTHKHDCGPSYPSINYFRK